MTAYNLLKELYPQELKNLEEKFPSFTKKAKEIRVIPWQEEFNVFDKNPEVIDTLQLLEMMLRSGLISKEEFEREVRRLPGYASKTVGMALKKEKAVSFRNKTPNFWTIVHEIGHIHFDAGMIEWHAEYGGGEVLFSLVLKGKIDLSEEQIKKYMEISKAIYQADREKLLEIYKNISEIIGKSLDLPEDLITLEYTAGTLPSISFPDKETEERFFMSERKEMARLVQEKILPNLKTEELKNLLFIFWGAYLTDGIIYRDPFYSRYASEIFKNLDKIL